MKRIATLYALTLAGITQTASALAAEPVKADALWQNTQQYLRASTGWVAGTITSAYQSSGKRWKEQADLVPTARLESWKDGEPVRKMDERADSQQLRSIHLSSAIANHPELILADCPQPKPIKLAAADPATSVYECKIVTKAVNYVLTTIVDKASGRPLRVTAQEQDSTAQIEFTQNAEGISLPVQYRLDYRPANTEEAWTITMQNLDWLRKPEAQIKAAIQPAFLRLTEFKMQSTERSGANTGQIPQR
ncbi:hypothetical protein [Undibacterium crateris]|uniref:hypothetical protein n=1 Tax=Undibacterium crateris TaxID=2528175 RepID=UPI00138983F8|nr:hypothetical protein [Undibacterium crateris]NDI87006.1 hypothetical protein [Undibacterium crateris]